MFPLTIISGGQTGADRAALDAALEAGVPCGGWCPADRAAEDGPIDPRYPLKPLARGGYRQRTRQNVLDSDATVILAFGAPAGGSAQTLADCRDLGRPVLVIDARTVDETAGAGMIRDLVRARGVRVLNIAGPRASEQPGIGDYVKKVVRRLVADLQRPGGPGVTSMMGDVMSNQTTPVTDGFAGRPSWDDYFLAMAEQVSRRSPDPNTKHGCVLVDRERRVVSTGYNGPVAGLPNGMVPLTRPEKYTWFIHAEDNAVAFARCDLRDATAYVTGAPCAPCFRRLLQVGVRRIVYAMRQSACITPEEREACRRMAEALKVEVVERNYTAGQ